MARHAGFLLAAAAVLGASEAAAQVIAPVDRTVAGLVRDSVSGRPLSGAVLYVASRRDEHRSGGDGRFRIEHTTPQDTVLIARRIGYVPRRIGVPHSVSATLIDVGEVYLRPVATELDRIAVEAEELRLYPHLADFYRRKQEELPGGEFITREDIQRSGARKTSETLRRSAKIEMDCPNVRLGDDACTARNRRGRDIRLGAQTGNWSFDRCEMDLYLDGLRSTLKVDEVPLYLIAAIEIYASGATTPTVFGRGRCGVIAIWTTGARGG
ncbi:MAG: carboxypeptidase regulatory-like domain-containing protein [Gemmatimonadetes bacterium]|nr:carboxypeptidase regulatory-like domain-containing protein [Gemmatimonadota bacterium]